MFSCNPSILDAHREILYNETMEFLLYKLRQSFDSGERTDAAADMAGNNRQTKRCIILQKYGALS